MPGTPKVLLIEDSRTQAERLRALFAREEWSILLAASAEEGLAELARVRPDLIVVDYYLPGMKGDEFCREVRMNVNTRGIPVLMLTVENTDIGQLRGLESGADDYLSKSVDPDILIARIRALLRSSQSPDAIFEQAGARFERARVLAIDDSPTFLEYLARELASEGYDLEKARAGREGLARAEREHFDCILVDLMMPDIAGLEVCRRLAMMRHGMEDPRAIIILTSHEEKDRMIEALEAGADDFVGKSSDISVLKSRVRALLRRNALLEDNRRIAGEIRKKELDAVRARADKAAAEERAAMAEELARKGREIEEANRKLKAALEVTRAITEHAAEALFMTDAEGRVTFMNPGAERMFGYTSSELIGRSFHEVLHSRRPDGSPYPASECPFARSVGTPMTFSGYDDVFFRKDGTPVDVVCSKAPVLQEGAVTSCVLVVHDNSERKRQEERLRQTQKLESIGLLAGGVAHDFNNLLTAILGNASLALGEVPEPAKERLQAVVSGAEKAADLTRQLLAYAGKGRFLVRDVNLSSTVTEITGLLRLSVPKSITVEVDLAPDLPAVQADEGQMQQIIMNLVINASEAIGETQPGTIQVSTEAVELPAGVSDRLGQQLQSGSYVRLRVKDTGCGMEEPTLARVFDPFFTTKFMGRGLGMAAVSGIVRSHNGGIHIDSVPGRGTIVTVDLPAVRRKPKPQPAAAQSFPDARGAGTVLVVDDEDTAREFIGTVLQRNGYSVLSARDGREAVEVFDRNPGMIDLVVLDLLMPVASGADALAHIRSRRPDAKILVTSGYSRQEAMRMCRDGQATDFIQKPYTAQQLALKISSVLSGGAERRL